MNTPSLSVVMPVKNALPYLDAAIESILNQTFSDFEFVIRDDNSTDGTLDRLREWAKRDERIRLFEGASSLGPAGSSNWVVEQARAPLVARMDADDVSLPGRFRFQLELLQENPDVVLVGSVWEGIDRDGRVVREPDLSVLGTNSFAAPFAHGSIMFRREAFDRVGGYRPECNFWEDLDLFMRISQVGRVLVSVEPLYQHRFSETSTRLQSHARKVEEAVELMFRCRRAHERGEDYTLELRRPRPSGSKRRYPNIFLSLGFITLWSGHRPNTLVEILKRGQLSFDFNSARALVWAVMATAAPRTLRRLMRFRLHVRSGKARRIFAGQKAVEWSPRGSAAARA